MSDIKSPTKGKTKEESPDEVFKELTANEVISSIGELLPLVDAENITFGEWEGALVGKNSQKAFHGSHLVLCDEKNGKIRAVCGDLGDNKTEAFVALMVTLYNHLPLIKKGLSKLDPSDKGDSVSPSTVDTATATATSDTPLSRAELVLELYDTLGKSPNGGRIAERLGYLLGESIICHKEDDFRYFIFTEDEEKIPHSAHNLFKLASQSNHLSDEDFEVFYDSEILPF